jgi:threonine aldolase
VGSVLVGSAKDMARARSFRKALGGGMRQAGILAAAGLMALEEGPARLAADHAHARMMAEAIAGCEGVEIDLESVQTNIVIFKVKDAAAVVAAMKEKGVVASAIGPEAVRLVTHFEVSKGDCERAVEVVGEVLESRE